MITIAKPRRLYSARNSGQPDDGKLDLDTLSRLFLSAYRQFRAKGYFDEAFGYVCVDAGEVPGTAGDDLDEYVLLHTRKHGLWPLTDKLAVYNEADLFDMIEFLHDHVSKPLEGHYHQHADCGMHWEKFGRITGQVEYREVMLELLRDYGPGYQMNGNGEIMQLGPKGMGKLLKAKPPTKDQDITGRLDAAINSFQRYGSSIDDRRHAVRDLADILEKLRPQAKAMLGTQEEKDLFNIANNFGIRHFNDKQRTDYDPAWLSWMFHCYLAAIHMCLHLVKRKPSVGS